MIPSYIGICNIKNTKITWKPPTPTEPSRGGQVMTTNHHWWCDSQQLGYGNLSSTTATRLWEPLQHQHSRINGYSKPLVRYSPSADSRLRTITCQTLLQHSIYNRIGATGNSIDAKERSPLLQHHNWFCSTIIAFTRISINHCI